MPDAQIISCTCWAPGIFAAPLTLGNASLSKLFSGVRDPLNIVRSNGLRMFVRNSSSERWELLASPSAFEMALDHCGWYFKRDDRMLTVRCITAERDPALTFKVQSEGSPVELLICGEVAGGPMEYETSPRLLLDHERKRIVVRPEPESPLGKAQPHLAFHIVTSTADDVESIGGDEALFRDGKPRLYPYLTIQTKPTTSFSFTVLGTLEDPVAATDLCVKYESPSSVRAASEPASGFCAR